MKRLGTVSCLILTNLTGTNDILPGPSLGNASSATAKTDSKSEFPRIHVKELKPLLWRIKQLAYFGFKD